MTPEEKVAELVVHIKKEFPEGCEGADCSGCLLNTSIEGADGWYLCGVLNHGTTFKYQQT